MVNVEKLQCIASAIKTVGDLQPVYGGTGAELCGFITKAMESIGCPSWLTRSRESRENPAHLSVYLFCFEALRSWRETCQSSSTRSASFLSPCCHPRNSNKELCKRCASMLSGETLPKHSSRMVARSRRGPGRSNQRADLSMTKVLEISMQSGMARWWTWRLTTRNTFHGHEIGPSESSDAASGRGNSAAGFADGGCGQPQHVGQGVLEVISAHVMEKRRHMMLLREQCQQSRTVPFFDKQDGLLVTEPGDIIFVLWVNSSERQARQVSVDGLGRMAAVVSYVNPTKCCEF